MALRQYLNKSRAIQSSSIEQEDTTSASLLHQNNAAILRTQHELRDEQEQHRYYSVLLPDIDLSLSPAVDRAVIQKQRKRGEAMIRERPAPLHPPQSHTPLTSNTKTSVT